jgi:hypothetical protein
MAEADLPGCAWVPASSACTADRKAQLASGRRRAIAGEVSLPLKPCRQLSELPPSKLGGFNSRTSSAVRLLTVGCVVL